MATGPGSRTPAPALSSRGAEAAAALLFPGLVVDPPSPRRASPGHVVATAYLLGVSTRRVERLAEQLGIKSLSRSQVSEMATHLDTQVSAFRERPLDAGPNSSCGSMR